MNIIDARALPDRTVLTTEVAVIGTGPAGTTIALELQAAGIDVLLLEGGGLNATPEAQATLRGDQTSQAVEPLDKVRQKALGGTSHRWGGRTFPYDPLDFEPRPRLDLPGWPISRAELEPYYRRAAVALDTGAYQFTAAEAFPGSTPHVLENRSSVIADEAVWRFAPPQRFGDVLLRGMKDAPNLRLVHDANVTRLDFDPATGRVGSIAVSLGGHRTAHVRPGVVVVAAGGLESTRLLLASDAPDPDRRVGRNFMIHPVAEVGRLVLNDPAAPPDLIGYQRTWDRVWARRMLQLRESVRRDHDLLNLGMAAWYMDPRNPDHGDPVLSAFALARKALVHGGGFKGAGMHRRYADLHDPGAHLKNLAGGLPEFGAFGTTWVRDRWISRRTVPAFARPSRSGEYRIRLDAEQSPSLSNRVELSTERDAYGMARLAVHHTVVEADRRNYHRSLELMARAMSDTSFATFEPPSVDEMLSVPLVDATHQMGLLAMAVNGQPGVCDRDLRLRSSSNTYVASTAVFPTSGMAGPTMTLVALATRLADHLIRTRPKGAFPVINDVKE